MIPRQIYQNRRKQLAHTLPNNSIALLFAANEQLRNGDVHYHFRQASDFYYLTGFNEPNAVLLVIGGTDGDSYLFNSPRDLAMEQWTGKRMGQEGACVDLGMVEAFPIDSFNEKLPDFLNDKTKVYYAFNEGPALYKTILTAVQSLKKQIRQGKKAPGALADIGPVLAEMRLFKSLEEIQCMQRAADISVRGHERAMRCSSRLHWEHEVQAELLYEFTRQGALNVAYGSIVAGGENACVLHYTDNNQALNRGELLLIDAGAEWDNYAADITRTFPINGRFTEDQARVYELVLRAQKAGIVAIKPGLPFADVQKTMVSILTEGLQELGILKGRLEALIETAAYRPFYMHGSGHWLGLDVHDAGAYTVDGTSRPLEPGMVLTVEPGLYLSAAIPGLDPRWHGIGIRIEDDILVTAAGHENLTGALAVEIADIEALARDS